MRPYLKYLIVGVIVLASSTVVFSQDKVDPNIQKLSFSGTQPFSSLPFKKFEAKLEGNESVEVEGIKIRKKTFRLSKPLFVTTETCGTFGDNQLPDLDEGFFYRVREFASYEFAEKIFAYEVNYEFFDSDSGSEIGATTSAFYMDESGDKKFAMKCVKDFRIDRLPIWIKILHEQRQKS